MDEKPGMGFIRKIDKKALGRHVDFHPFCENADQ